MKHRVNKVIQITIFYNVALHMKSEWREIRAGQARLKLGLATGWGRSQSGQTEQDSQCVS
jgi:hypothetical protein